MIMLKQWQQQLKDKGEVYLRIKVLPQASKTQIKEIMDDETIKINVAAAAEKNKANKELMAFLAVEFQVPKDNVCIISGQTDRLKLVKISQA